MGLQCRRSSRTQCNRRKSQPLLQGMSPCVFRPQSGCSVRKGRPSTYACHSKAHRCLGQKHIILAKLTQPAHSTIGHGRLLKSMQLEFHQRKERCPAVGLHMTLGCQRSYIVYIQQCPLRRTTLLPVHVARSRVESNRSRRGELARGCAGAGDGRKSTVCHEGRGRGETGRRT